MERLSPEEKIALLKDPKFYLENFCKIKTKNQGRLENFILNEAQKDLFNAIRKHSRTIILKARQVGFSTAVTGFFYHNTITNPATTTVLIGYNTPLVVELLDKVKTFYRSTPDEIKPTIHFNSKYEMSFPAIDSKIIVLPSTENVGRGYTIHNCLATELSAWEKAEEKMISLEAAVPIGGRLIIESCVTGDTIVFTDNGPRYVRDIHDWDNHLLGFSEGKQIQLDGHYGMQPTTTYYNSGIQKGFHIKTRNGFELGMSSVHKMFVLRGDTLKFVRAKDLKEGDLLAIKYGQESWGHNDSITWKASPYGFNKGFLKQFSVDEMTPDLAYLLGLIVGDGYVDFKQGRVVVTSIDKEVIDFLTAQPFGLKFLQSKGDDTYHFVCKNSSFVEFLSAYVGMKQVKAPGKEVPFIVFEWSRSNVIAFLSGLFDADGCCRKDRQGVSFSSTSKSIIHAVQALLLNFGIISRVYAYNAKPSKKVSVWSSGYKLELTSGNSQIFLDKIGFRIKRKQNNYRHVKSREYIPGVGGIIKKNKLVLGWTYKDVQRNLNKSLYSASGNITYEVLGKILEKCPNKESQVYKRLVSLFKYKYFYDPIVSIVPIEEHVYDFTVDNGHTVTYSGLVGHQTPRGVGNYYHRLWSTNNDYHKLQYGWWWGYSKEEIDVIRRRMNNPRKFAQEYGLEFLASGRSVFDTKIVQAMTKFALSVGDKNLEGDVVYKTQNDLIVYKKPEHDGLYVVGADVAEGVEGGDYSVAVIFDRRTGEEVAMFRGHIAPDIFGKKLYEWGRWYKDATMIVEINNHGISTVDALKNLSYPSMYFRMTKFEGPGMSFADKLGWKTTKLTRPLMIDDLSQAVREGTLKIHSKEILNEMMTFVYDDSNKMVAEEGCHDDCVFATGIAFQGFKVISKGPLEQIEYGQHLPLNFAY